MLGLVCITGPAPIAHLPQTPVGARRGGLVKDTSTKLLARRQEQEDKARVLMRRTVARVGSFSRVHGALKSADIHGVLFEGKMLSSAVDGLKTIRSHGEKALSQRAEKLLTLKVEGVPLSKLSNPCLVQSMAKRNVSEPGLERIASQLNDVARQAMALRVDFCNRYGLKALSDYLPLSKVAPGVVADVKAFTYTFPYSKSAKESRLDSEARNELHDAVLNGGDALAPALKKLIRCAADACLLSALVDSLDRGADPAQSPIVSALDNLVSKQPNLSVVLDGLIRYTQELQGKWLKSTNADIAARLNSAGRDLFFVNAFKKALYILEPHERAVMEAKLTGAFGHQLKLILYPEAGVSNAAAAAMEAQLNGAFGHPIKLITHYEEEVSSEAAAAFKCLRMVFDKGVFGLLATSSETFEFSLFYEAAKTRVEKLGAYGPVLLG